MKRILIITILSMFILSGCSIDKTRVSNYKSAIGCDLIEMSRDRYTTVYDAIDENGNSITLHVSTDRGLELRDSIADSIIVDNDVKFDIVYNANNNLAVGISLHDRSE